MQFPVKKNALAVLALRSDLCRMRQLVPSAVPTSFLYYFHLCTSASTIQASLF